MFRSLLAVIVFGIAANFAYAQPPIPPYLVGIWVTDGAVLKNRLLFEGQALYLGADGVGALVGGTPPIGIKIVASFNAEKSTIEFDTYEGKQKGPHGSIPYDSKSNTMDLGASLKQLHQLLHREYDNFPEDTKRALGLN